jgi:hypothetical protein
LLTFRLMLINDRIGRLLFPKFTSDFSFNQSDLGRSYKKITNQLNKLIGD